MTDPKRLNTQPGAVTRWTVNIGPKTAEALNYVVSSQGVTNTEALRVLVAAGYAALRAEAAPSTQDETDWEFGYQIGDSEPFGPMSRRAAELSLLGIDGVIKKRRPAGPWVSVSSVEGDKEDEHG